MQMNFILFRSSGLVQTQEQMEMYNRNNFSLRFGVVEPYSCSASHINKHGIPNSYYYYSQCSANSFAYFQFSWDNMHNENPFNGPQPFGDLHCTQRHYKNYRRFARKTKTNRLFNLTIQLNRMWSLVMFPSCFGPTVWFKAQIEECCVANIALAPQPSDVGQAIITRIDDGNLCDDERR